MTYLEASGLTRVDELRKPSILRHYLGAEVVRLWNVSRAQTNVGGDEASTTSSFPASQHGVADEMQTVGIVTKDHR